MEHLVKGKFDCNLLRYYPNKKNATEADRQRLEKDLNTIKDKLAVIVQELEHIRSDIPTNWQAVRREIEGLRHQNIIPKTEFEAICRRPEINADPEACLEYLRTIGVCLYYSAERNLKKQVIVNYNWAVKGVYKVLDDPEIKKRFGRFNEAEMERIWQPNAENAGQYNFECYFNELDDLMKRFKLYYPLNKPENDIDRVAPSLLPQKQGNDDDRFVWEESNTDLRMQIRYGFLPPALFSRFIVGLHTFIAGDNRNRVWQNEVWFEYKGAEALAYVTKIENKDSIEIRVRGRDPEKRKILLSFLLRELDDLHAEIKGIEVEKMVPCICEGCKNEKEPHFYVLKDLEEYKMYNIPEIHCNKFKRNKVSVDTLLGNVFQRHADSTDVKKKIMILIESDNINDALDLLIQIDQCQATLLRGRFKSWKKEKTAGILSWDELNNERNAIRQAILECLK